MKTDLTTPIRPDTHRFLVDLMLGTLVAYLRICGYDTVYVGDRAIETDAEIAHAARTEHRVLITRDASLAARATHAIHIETQSVAGQLRELHDHGVVLKPTTTPQRCGTCNTPLAPVTPQSELPDYVPSCRPAGLWRCPACQHYFWKGSHWDAMHRTLTMATQ